MFTRFDEIQSLPVENIKEKPKRCRWMDGKTNGCENSIHPPPPQTQFAGGEGGGIKNNVETSLIQCLYGTIE